MLTVDPHPRQSLRTLPDKRFQCNIEFLTAHSWLSFSKQYCGHFAAISSRIGDPLAVALAQQYARETFKSRLTRKETQSFSVLFVEPSKVRDPWFRPQVPGCLWKCRLRQCQKLTAFLPIYMICYLVIGKTNKQTGWFDMIWSWQVTLRITNHFALSQIIRSLVQRSFWKTKVGPAGTLCPPFSLFFFLIGTLSAFF